MRIQFIKTLLRVIFLFFWVQCSEKKAISEYLPPADLNYPSPGFDVEGSDPLAIVLADRVMSAMGGREAWDKTRYLKWNFFDRHSLLWDKEAAKVRIEIQKRGQVILLDLNKLTGKVFQQGIELSNPDSVAFYLLKGKKIWMNDSYWLLMPFKLKDTGVTLTYVKEEVTQSGELSDVLKLTFKDVGATPDNAYWVWVSKDQDLIKQWAYFKHFTDSLPQFVSPWDDYKEYGEILLATGRGWRNLTEVAVLSSVPPHIFISL
tara:strand:+ start:6280 stop:7062 length:783 start_codon:yes stop_codon:yes gene_type:complete